MRAGARSGTMGAMSGEPLGEATSDDPPAASPVRLSIAPGRAASAIAFASSSWAAVTRVHGVASGQHEPPVLLGDPDRSVGNAAPLLFSTTGGAGVVYLDPDGAFVATLGEAGALRRPRERIAPAARALALAPGRRGTRALVWDGRRVHAIGIDERGVPSGERSVWLERAGRTAHLAAARVGTGTIAAIAFDDEPALHVLSEEGGRPRVVRHELATPVHGLSMVGVGNRAGCAIVLSDGDRVAVSQLDAWGRFVERPSTLLEGRGTRWDAPVVVFVEDGFAVLVRDSARALATLHRFEGGAALATLDRVSSPPAAAWHEKRLWVATATTTAGADDVTVLVQRTTLGKRQPALVTPLVLEPPAALRTRRAEDRALRTLSAAASELSTTTYRGLCAGDTAASVDRDARALVVGGVRASIEVDEGGFLLVVVARDPGAPADPEPLGSLERLARWVRGRVSKAAFEAAVSEASWVEARAAELGGTGRVAPTRTGLLLVVALAALPSGAALARFVGLLREELRRRAANPAPR